MADDLTGALSVTQLFQASLLVDVDSMTGENTPELAPEIIHGILRRGHILMLTGPPKAGKSWAMAQLAYAVATGGDWMGFACEVGTVCYVDTELDPNSLYNRFDMVRGGMELANSGGNIKALPLRGQTVDAETLVNSITAAYGEDAMPSLVIIDSIYSIESGDENSAGDMRDMMQQLGRLASYGCAIAFAHHHAKGSAGSRNVIDRGSGSGVFGRFVDAMVDLTPTVADEEQQEMLAERYGDRVVPMRMSFVLREFRDPGTCDVVLDFPLLARVDGDWMSDAPEDGSAGAARVKGGESNRKRIDDRWSKLDEAIGRAVNACTVDSVPPTRRNVAERMGDFEGGDVSVERLTRWTRSSAKTKWRATQVYGEWILICTDDSWSAEPPKT